MQIANCRMKLNSLGSDILKVNVTPAEILILNEGFEKAVNGMAVKEVEVLGTVDRSDETELARLRRRYANLRPGGAREGQNVVNKLFPGVNAVLPQTFAKIGIATKKGEKFKAQTYNPIPEQVIMAETVEADPLETPEALEEIQPLEASDASATKKKK